LPEGEKKEKASISSVQTLKIPYTCKSSFLH